LDSEKAGEVIEEGNMVLLVEPNHPAISEAGIILFFTLLGFELKS
jgi:hypothetical protein